MVRKPNETFAEIKIPINSKYSEKSLRQIEMLTNCNIAIQKGTAVFYECMYENELSSEYLNLSIDYDNIENIAGLSENNDLYKLKLDYSNRDNLDIINTLPIVTINYINYFKCNDNGNFSIVGIAEGKGILKKYSNVEIQFSYPDSSFICEIRLEETDIIIMDCKNKEKFPVSTIMFDQTYVKDDDGNILFKLNKYINQKQFGCDVGILDSEIENPSKDSSKKLPTWAIAIIVIAAILLLASLIIILIKKCKKRKVIQPITQNKDIVSVNTISEKLQNDDDSYVGTLSNNTSNHKRDKKNFVYAIKKIFNFCRKSK